MERLIIIENGEEVVFNIENRVVTIGRSSKNDITIKDRNASRRHCNIIKVGDSWFVVDCDSQNGTCVNQNTIKKHELEDGDKITVGAAEIIFVVAQDNQEHTEESMQLKKSPVKGNNTNDIPLPPQNLKNPIVPPPPIVLESQKQKSESLSEKLETEPLPIDINESSQAEKKSSNAIVIANNVSKKQEVEDSCEEEETGTHESVKLENKSPQIERAPKPESKNPTSEENNSVESKDPKLENKRDKNNQIVKYTQDFYQAFKEYFAKEIVGYDYVAELLFIALITNEHCLILGDSGTGKLSTVRTVSQLLGLSFQRMSNLTIEDYIAKNEKYNVEGLFANHINFIDHDNAISPNVQNIIFDFLENQKLPGERKTTTFQQVNMLITSNLPSLNEITLRSYKDSFLFEISLNYLTMEQEKQILQRNINPVNKAKKSANFTRYFSYFQMLMSSVQVNDSILETLVNLVENSHPQKSKIPEVKKYVKFGVGRKGAISLLKASQAYAVLNSRDTVIAEDIKKMAVHVLSHRIVLNEEAHNNEINKKQIIQMLFK